jgi:hypothetical protein
MMRPLAVVLSVLAVQACAHEQVLEPAAGAALVPGRENVAETVAAGVTVMVSGDSWKGDPRNLDSLFTPVRVTLENHSGKTLRVNYRDFSLAGASGFHYPAISPIEAHGGLSSREAPSSPSLRRAGWEHEGFYLAPQYSYAYPGLGVWSGPFAYEPPDYGGFYARWPERLPTRDILSEALPEGVVQDGGRVAGFVYFRRVTARESAVEFELTLADASDGKAFALVAIPFQTTQGGDGNSTQTSTSERAPDSDLSQPAAGDRVVEVGP